MGAMAPQTIPMQISLAGDGERASLFGLPVALT
jgi:hypothetical protein